jgi:hypothetical protein
LESLIVPRPTAYVFAQKVNLVDSKEEAIAIGAKVAGRPMKIQPIPDFEAKNVDIISQSFREVT